MFIIAPVELVPEISGVWSEDGQTGSTEIQVGTEGGVVSIVKDGILRVFDIFPAPSVINKEQLL